MAETTTAETVTRDPIAVLEDIRRQCEAATPPPWTLRTENCDCGGDYPCGHGEYVYAIRTTAPHVTRPDGSNADHDFDHSEICELTDADAEFIVSARKFIPRLLAGYDALLKAHKPVQVYADADGCGHECPPEPDWQADPDKAAVDAWDAYQDEHTYGTTPSGENDIRICMLTPDHQACPACSALVYSLWGDDEYVDASRCVALPLIAAALSGSETPS